MLRVSRGSGLHGFVWVLSLLSESGSKLRGFSRVETGDSCCRSDFIEAYPLRYPLFVLVRSTLSQCLVLKSGLCGSGFRGLKSSGAHS